MHRPHRANHGTGSPSVGAVFSGSHDSLASAVNRVRMTGDLQQRQGTTEPRMDARFHLEVSESIVEFTPADVGVNHRLYCPIVCADAPQPPLLQITLFVI